MRIAVISDSHLGYGKGERENDALDSFREALKKSKTHDLILLPGDIFDTKVPSPEVLADAMELLNMPKESESGASLSEGIGKDVEALSHLTKKGVPVVSIHGTHERRTKGLVNPLQALEKAGFLVHLHCNGIVIEKDGERICIQGLSGVPDRYAEGVLKEWGPKPKENCFNIFMLHQSMTGFVNAPDTLDVGSLPEGFDLYICGHMHEDKISEAHGKPLLIPGSLIQTQLTKEAPQRRVFYSLTVENGGLKDMERVELEDQRDVYFRELEGSKEAIEKEIDGILSESHAKKPLIRVRLSTEMEQSEMRETEAMFSERAIVSFRKKRSDAVTASAPGLEEQKLSVQELGRKLLQENLQKAGLDQKTYEQVFEALLDNKPQEALEFLRNSPKYNHGKGKKAQESSQEGCKKASEEEAREETCKEGSEEKAN